MRRWLLGAAAAGLAVAGVVAAVVWSQSGLHPDRLLAAYHANTRVAGVQIGYPFVDTLFPPESVPPAFRWTDAGDLEQAEQASRRALAINPANPRALGFLGSALTARRQYDEAERCFRESLKSEPDSPFVHLNFGLLLLARGQQEQGLAEMRAAVKLEPDMYDARYKLGTELLKAKQFPEAETHLSEAVRIWASNVNARSALARALHAQGKDEAALTQFKATLTQNADYAPGLLGMARVYAESSQPGIRSPATAVQLAERVVQMDARQRAQALLVIAGVHADAGRYAEAVSSAAAALTIATSQGQEEFAAEIRRRLDRYRAKAKSS